MAEEEYRFTATVLDKTKGKVTPSGKAPGEANCLLTESELVIDTGPPIRIPVARIRDSQVIYEHLAVPEYASLTKQPTVQPLGTLRLLYVDDLDQKHWLYLKMAEGDAGLINATLGARLRKPQSQRMNRLTKFDKICCVLAFALGLLFLIAGVLGLFMHYSVDFTLRPPWGIALAFFGWGMVRAIYVAW